MTYTHVHTHREDGRMQINNASSRFHFQTLRGAVSNVTQTEANEMVIEYYIMRSVTMIHFFAIMLCYWMCFHFASEMDQNQCGGAAMQPLSTPCPSSSEGRRLRVTAKELHYLLHNSCAVCAVESSFSEGSERKVMHTQKMRAPPIAHACLPCIPVYLLLQFAFIIHVYTGAKQTQEQLDSAFARVLAMNDGVHKQKKNTHACYKLCCLLL